MSSVLAKLFYGFGNKSFIFATLKHLYSFRFSSSIKQKKSVQVAYQIFVRGWGFASFNLIASFTSYTINSNNASLLPVKQRNICHENENFFMCHEVEFWNVFSTDIRFVKMIAATTLQYLTKAKKEAVFNLKWRFWLQYFLSFITGFKNNRHYCILLAASYVLVNTNANFKKWAGALIN